MKRALDEVLEAARREDGGRTQAFLVGAPYFAPPSELLDALREAASRRRFDYGPPAGLPRLRRTIADLHAGQGMAIGPENVVVTHGSKGGLLALFSCLIEAGDEVLHALPS